MEQDEYKNGEKVLYKTKGKLSLPHKKPEEADCFLTDRNIVIEAEQPIRIAVARIADCALGVEQPTRYGAARGKAKPMGTVTLTYFDDLNRKQRLSLEMPTYEAGLLSHELRTRIPPTVGRGSVSIKEKDEQHMVIEVSRGGRSLIFGLVFCFVWILLVQLIPGILFRVLFSLVGVYGILAILRMPMAIRVALDKPTQTVTIRKPSLFLVRRQRVIPFSYVSSVVIDYDPQPSGGHPQTGTTWQDAWKVSLNIGEKFEIAHTTDKEDMFYLASEIRRFIGRELVDNSAKPEVSLQRFFSKVKGFFRK